VAYILSVSVIEKYEISVTMRNGGNISKVKYFIAGGLTLSGGGVNQYLVGKVL
jgi:hypothetical protein